MNDIVLVVDEEVQRGKWPLGIVTDVELSSNGLVRVRSCSSQWKGKETPNQQADFPGASFINYVYILSKVNFMRFTLHF